MFSLRAADEVETFAPMKSVKFSLLADEVETSRADEVSESFRHLAGSAKDLERLKKQMDEPAFQAGVQEIQDRVQALTDLAKRLKIRSPHLFAGREGEDTRSNP